MLAKPTESYAEDYYRFEWPNVEMILERFTESREDIACECTVRSTHPTKGGTLVDGKRLLLLGPNSLRDMAKALSLRDEEPDWGGMLEQATTLARRRYREGAPAIDLWDEELGDSGKYLVSPFLFDNAVNILYGSGDSGKSLFALLLGIAITSGEDVAGLIAERTGAVLYLDWEDDAITHQERLYGFCNGAGVPLESGRVIYRRMSSSLRESSREIRKDIAAAGAAVVIIDSLGMACGGDPSDAGNIIQTMLAARSLGVPVIAIHHIAKDAKDKSTPYGSVYASNEARMTWFVESNRDDSTLTMVLTNFKANRGKNQGRRSFLFQFTEDAREVIKSITVTPIGYSASKEVGDGGQKWKIAQYLKDAGAQEVAAIAAHFSLTTANVRKVLGRGKGQLFVNLPSGQWGLLMPDEGGETRLDLSPETVSGETRHGGPLKGPSVSRVSPSPEEEMRGELNAPL